MMNTYCTIRNVEWAAYCFRFLALCLFLSMPAALQAQIELFDETDTDTDDEIIVVDDNGNEEEIDFPEAMGVYLDSLMTLYMSKTYLSNDKECQTADTNPQFTKEEYIDRLYRMPTIIEMPWNEVVQACIDRYTVKARRQVSYLLGACNFYMPFFEEALEAYQLPLELKYLPIIESALNPTAVSHAGAAGLWQFMPSSGKAYGLEMNTLVDERRDPVKASWAAARLLRDLYNLFGDWHLAIAAYNCGPENINKAIRRAGGEKDYWKIYSFLPRETRGYVPAFIAANYVMTYYCDHNICPVQTQLPVKTDTVMINRYVTFEQISAVCGFSIEMMRSLNPQYRRDIVPGATTPSALRLPVGDITKFIDMQDSIFASTEGAFEKRMEVAVDERVIAPSKSKKRGRRGRSTSKSSSRASRTVTVKNGDTLSSIARRNGTTVNKLKKLNGIKGNIIQKGKKIRVK